MKEEDRNAIRDIFKGEMSPLCERMAKVETKMCGVEEKLEKVGNCGEHAQRVELVERSVERIEGRMHNATITILVGLLAILGSLLVGVKDAIAQAIGKIFH